MFLPLVMHRGGRCSIIIPLSAKLVLSLHSVHMSTEEGSSERKYCTLKHTVAVSGQGVLVAGRTHKRARSDYTQVQIQELEIFPCTPC